MESLYLTRSIPEAEVCLLFVKTNRNMIHISSIYLGLGLGWQPVISEGVLSMAL